MMQKIQRFAAIALLITLLVTPVIAQDDAPPDATPEATPTVEVTAQAETEVNDVNPNLRYTLQFASENNALIWILVLVGMVLLGRSVPKETVEKMKSDAAKTETPVDDVLATILDMLNGMKANNASPPTPVTQGTKVQNESMADELRRIREQQSIPTIRIEPAIVRQPLNVPVNKNPTLGVSQSGMGNWGGDDKRAKDTPDDFDVFWQPLMAGDEYAPPPEIHKRDDGLNVALAHRRGRLFMHQDISGAVQAGQRYLLAVRCQCEMKLKADADMKGAIAIRGQLLAGEAVIRNMNAWSPNKVEDLSGGFNALWAIEASRAYGNLSYQVLLEVGNIHAVPFDDLSKIVITAIELIPVAADYGNENLIRL